MSNKLLVFIDNISGGIITEIPDDEIHTIPLNLEIKSALDVRSDEDDKCLHYIITNMDITFDNCNFTNPIMDAYTNWMETWRAHDMDVPEWRRNINIFSRFRSQIMREYVNRLRNIVCAYRDPVNEDVTAFVERSNTIRSQIRTSNYLNSIERSDLQTYVTTDGMINIK